MTADPECVGAGIPPWSRPIARPEPTVADAMVLLLESMGYEVRTACDGFQALDELTAFQPGAVLLDLDMPRLDGFETARRMRATPEGRDVLLVALTGWGSEDDGRRTTEAGFDHHLVKPVDPDALAQLLGGQNNA